MPKLNPGKFRAQGRPLGSFRVFNNPGPSSQRGLSRVPRTQPTTYRIDIYKNKERSIDSRVLANNWRLLANDCSKRQQKFPSIIY
jgi:hypothetical protein